MDPVTGIQTSEAIVGLGLLVERIIKGTVKVCRYKSECRQLANDSVLLLRILEKRTSNLAKLEMLQQLNDSLVAVLGFVTQCQDWSIATVIIDVAIRNRFPTIKDNLYKLITHFNTEVGVSDMSSARFNSLINSKSG